MSMPALEACCAENPGAEIHMLCRPHLSALWGMQSVVHQIHEFSTGHKALRCLGAQLKPYKFSKAYILPNSFRSALAARLAGADERYGTAGNGRRYFLTHPVVFESDPDRQHQCWETFKILGLMPSGSDQGLPSPTLRVPAPSMTAADELIPSNAATWIGFIPAAARGASKEWPHGHFIELGERILATNCCGILLFGGAGDWDKCEAIRSALKGPVVNLAGKTDLQVWAACLKRCASVVANDSGGMHFAAALGVPVVAIYGITDPTKTGPLGPTCRLVKESGTSDRDISRNSRAGMESLAAISSLRVWTELQDVVRGLKEE